MKDIIIEREYQTSREKYIAMELQKYPLLNQMLILIEEAYTSFELLSLFHEKRFFYYLFLFDHNSLLPHCHEIYQLYCLLTLKKNLIFEEIPSTNERSYDVTLFLCDQCRSPLFYAIDSTKKIHTTQVSCLCVLKDERKLANIVLKVYLNIARSYKSLSIRHPISLVGKLYSINDEIR